MFEPQVYMLGSGYDGCNYVRIRIPAYANGFKTDKSSVYAEVDDKRKIQEEMTRADVVVFHRAEEQGYHNLAKMLKKDGKKIVMDNDDTFKLDDFHPLANFDSDGQKVDNLKRRSDNIDEFIKMCDLVTTSTEFLAKEYRELNHNVAVLPNCVDPEDWDEPLRNETDKVRIGIVGSAAIEYDYLHIKDEIRKLSERDDVEIVMFGLGNMSHRAKNPLVTKVFKDEYDFWDSIKFKHFPWVKVEFYPDTLNEMRLDMMLIPRKDNYFNRCKSNVKFLEASMCEIPVIAQSFEDGPYEEIDSGVNGILIKDNKDWENAIESLINDKELRRKLGKNAKEYTLKHYDINNNAHKWVNAYQKLYEN
jgi:glycosyltransferase involved in cell wall biosynthesis